MEFNKIVIVVTSVIIIAVFVYLGVSLILPLLKEGALIASAFMAFLLWCLWGFIKKF